MSEVVVIRYVTPPIIRAANLSAKTLLLLLLVVAVLNPDAAHLRGKAAELRVLAYPLCSLLVPVVWLLLWKDRASFPWLADLLITLTCYSDMLGNRMDLYDSVVWFDDWMHFVNTGLLAAAVILLTLPRTSSRARVVERGLAVGATAAIAWEIAEYFAFLSVSAGHNAYADTLGDLALGVLGSVVAALAVHGLWQRGGLVTAAPQLERSAAGRGTVD